jgi:hypothetical protein
MTCYEKMSTYCVMINGGSGVLVNAMSDKYSYVLTAKHVLKESNILTTHKGESINVIAVYEHHDTNLDCAVIQIESLPDIQQLSWPVSTLEHHSQLMLVGFPNTRRTALTEIKQQDGKLSYLEDKDFILTAEGIPSKELIDGMSGGGVYYIDDGEAYLVGVEYRMDGDLTVEHYGRLKCHELSRFEEIINHENLDPMVPCFMECFSRIKYEIFDFNVIEPRNVEKLHEKLNLVAVELVEKGLPMPYELMQRYGKSLLLSTEKESALHDKKLWIAYFEFIIICALIDGVDTINSAYLLALDKKRRIVYSQSAEHWVRNLESILKSAKNMLGRNGTIIINSPQENAPVLPPAPRLEYIIDDISSVPSDGPILQINNVAQDIYKTFTVTHHRGLCHSCVVDREDEYGAAMPSKLLRLFKGYYNEVIK